MIAEILLSVSIALLFFGVYIISLLIKKVMKYDLLFEALQDDLEANISFVQEAFRSEILSNEPAVIKFQKNLKETRERMIFYVTQLQTITNKQQFVEKRKDLLNRPVAY